MSQISTDFDLKNNLSDLFSNKKILLYFLTILAIRFLFVLIPPQFTTDLQRSIFYGQHFWDVWFNVYNLNPLQIDPTFHIIDPTTHQLAWPHNTYDYGVVSLLYYAIIGLLPFKTSILIIIAKCILNIVDIVTFILLVDIYSRNKEIPLIFWIVMIPFSSIEGQPLSFTILFFVSSIYFYKTNKKSLAYVIMAIGFHWKYVTILLLPYYLINDLQKFYSTDKNEEKNYLEVYKPIISFIIVITVLMFPILVSRYILSYIAFGGNLPVTSLPWNPFYIGFPLTISSFLLLFFIIGIIFQWYKIVKYEQGSILNTSGFLP